MDKGWMGPCGVNEVTCHVSGYDEEGILTYDWKVRLNNYFCQISTF